MLEGEVARKELDAAGEGGELTTHHGVMREEQDETQNPGGIVSPSTTQGTKNHRS